MALLKQKPKTEREKVEERREEVLAKGRKFKYPLQYAKHKLIINTVIVAVFVIVLMVVGAWAALYKFQSTGDMFYRVTQIIPVPVAEVEGEPVRYSDYLMIYRSNLITAEQQGGQLGGGEDAEMVRNGYKEAALRSAVEYAYALKLAKERGITVSDQEVDEAFDEHRKVGGVERTEESFLRIINDNFGMSKSEYKRMLYLTLIKAKVSQAVDERANEISAQVEQILAEHDQDFAAVAEALGENVEYQKTEQLVDNMNIDGGRSSMAMTLEPGQVSERFLSNNGDGYYYVRLVDKSDDQVNYASLKINFSEFDEQVMKLYTDNKVKVFIDLNLQSEPAGIEEVAPEIEESTQETGE